jgi:hypothetical protein
LQYAELGGFQDLQNDELPTLASQLIPHYPNKPTGGSKAYTDALNNLDGDMSQYIHDNTEDELTHEDFINAYLVLKGADPVNLEKFRTLQGSQATGANKDFLRLTNLKKLKVDTRFWTRYRSRTQNPDLGDSNFFPAVPTLLTGEFPAIPRDDSDLAPQGHIQAIANTAAFHFAFIEQGGTSLYPSLAQRVTSVEVLRILLSIGGTEICHFQTWHDKAGNAVSDPLAPLTDGALSFPNLNTTPGGEDFQTNLIMPEPTAFLMRPPALPVCSIIRPTETLNAAMGAVRALTDDGLFEGHGSDGFVEFLTDLAQQADAAQRGH